MPSRTTFRLPGGVGFCNAVRRALLSDVQAWAPYEVEVRRNTSCQTDEFVAHRIGLVPFERVGNGDTMELRAEGPCSVRARDLVGPAFDAVHGDLEVLRLGEGQVLDATVRYDKRAASVHSRYCMVAGVGMRPVDGSTHILSFETIDGRDPKAVLHEVLDALDARVERALYALSHQPETPPASMC